jgi:hypothetical protein
MGRSGGAFFPAACTCFDWSPFVIIVAFMPLSLERHVHSFLVAHAVYSKRDHLAEAARSLASTANASNEQRATWNAVQNAAKEASGFCLICFGGD